MAEGDVIVVRDGHQTLGPATLLTGGETEQGHIFRGPDDPADTPALLAILEPGDLWIDTTGTAPFSHKERNSANDGWDISAAVLKDGAGVVIATIALDSGGGIEVRSPLANMLLGADGAVELGLSSIAAQVTISDIGAVTVQNPNGSVAITPAGAISLWVSGFGPAVQVDNSGNVNINSLTLLFTNTGAPQVPASPTEQNIVDALVTLGIVTQAV